MFPLSDRDPFSLFTDVRVSKLSSVMKNYSLTKYIIYFEALNMFVFREKSSNKISILTFSPHHSLSLSLSGNKIAWLKRSVKRRPVR